MISSSESGSTMVLKRILVATDFSPAARLAVSRAGQLAKQNDANLYLVHARPDWNLFTPAPGANGGEQYRVVTHESERALGEELAYLQSTFGIQARGETRVGRASQVLLSVAAQMDPHLIVIGARGEHDEPSGVPFLGGTTLKLAVYADRPVLIVRTASDLPYKTSAAAVEYPSVAAGDLLRWAWTLVPEGDCHIVHAFDAPFAQRMRRHGVPEEVVTQRSEAMRSDAKAFIERMLDIPIREGQRCHTHFVCGEAVGAVLDEIGRCKPDVVVIGRHGHPPREHQLRSLGSVALRIAYHTAGDVLIVP